MLGNFRVVPILARRFLLSKASDQFLSFIAWVSVIGVALGVLALTVVTSVINGFEGELSKIITGMNGDVILYTRGDPIPHPETMEVDIQKVLSNVQAITVSFVTEMMVSGPNAVAGVVLEGIDLETVGRVTLIPKRLKRGKLPSQAGELALGSALADRIGAEVGSEVRIIAPFAGGEGEETKAESSTPRVSRGIVVGIVHMGMYEYDSKFVYAPISDVQNFLKQPGKATAFKIKLKSGSDTRLAANQLSDAFGYPYRAKDWGQLNKNLLYAIRLEKVVISIILSVIVIVAAFNVVSTLMMMIHDKTKEIAILKAMGFRPWQGFQLFCLIGMGIGTLGALSGVGVGLAVNLLLKKTRLIQLPPDIYPIGFLPVISQASEILLIMGVALLITFLATLYPAYKVSTQSPLEGIRYD